MTPSGAPASLPLGPAARLARLEASDAEPLFARIDEERGELARILPWVLDVRTLDHMRGHVAAALSRTAADEERTWVLWASGEATGMVSLTRLNPRRASGSIGLWLTGKARGQGLGTRALAAVATSAFDAMGLRRLDYRCTEDNLASQRLATHLGFRFEGISYEAEPTRSSPQSLVAFGLLAREWPVACAGREAAPILAMAAGDPAALGLDAIGSLDGPADVRLTVPGRGAIVASSDLALGEIRGFGVAPGPDATLVAARLLAVAEARLREAGALLVGVDVPSGTPGPLRAALSQRGYLPIGPGRWMRATNAPVPPEKQ